MAVSDDLPGLSVAGITADEVESKMVGAVRDFLEMTGHQVETVNLERDRRMSDFRPPYCPRFLNCLLGVTPEAYWARIKRIPLYPDRDTSDGDAVMCRTADGAPARVEKPERHPPENRERLVLFYEQFHASGSMN